jgi:hypothetical protein
VVDVWHAGCFYEVTKCNNGGPLAASLAVRALNGRREIFQFLVDYAEVASNPERRTR